VHAKAHDKRAGAFREVKGRQMDFLSGLISGAPSFLMSSRLTPK
jgi:hypothetical protein